MDILRGIWKNGDFIIFVIQTTRIIISNLNSKKLTCTHFRNACANNVCSKMRECYILP
jgi:hypothetical protein